MKEFIKYLAVFFLTAMVCFCLLVAVSCIPQKAIEENAKKSSVFFNQNENYYELLDGVRASTVDNYSDPILLNIVYNLDRSKPVESILWARYYLNTESATIPNTPNKALEATISGAAPNTEYLRYWHGSLVLLIPLLMIMPIKGVYVLFTIIIIALLATNIIVLWRQKEYKALTTLLAGYVASMGFMATSCLEYTWTYLILLTVSLISIRLIRQKKAEKLNMIFFLTGIITVFMDFLTAETITVTVPLIIVACVERCDEKISKTIFRNLKRIVLWGIGYGGMWTVKWIVSAIVLKIRVMEFVSRHIAVRSFGMLTGENLPGLAVASVKNNLSMLFPWNMGGVGKAIFVMIVLLLVYLICVFPKKNKNRNLIVLMLLISLVPFIRIIVMLNHSLSHTFYTYRAFFALISALTVVLLEEIDFEKIKKFINS